MWGQSIEASLGIALVIIMQVPVINWFCDITVVFIAPLQGNLIYSGALPAQPRSNNFVFLRRHVGGESDIV